MAQSKINSLDLRCNLDRSYLIILLYLGKYW